MVYAFLVLIVLHQRLIENNTVGSAHERRSGYGQQRWIRCVERSGFDGEQDVFRAAQVWYG